MLMALGPTGRVEAYAAAHGNAHHCFGCGRALVLKRGGQIVAHFAHAPDAACAWARGETPTHLAAKAALALAFAQRGLAVEIEAEVLSGAGDRRADILVRHPETGARFAIEVQHSALGLEAIEARTRAYAAAGVPVIWIATLDWSKLTWRGLAGGLRLSERYAPPPWQRFAAAYHGQLWFWAEGALWRGWLDEAWMARGKTEAGWVPSRRWSALTLEGPFAPEAVRIAARAVRVEPHESYAFPPGFAPNLVASGGRSGDAMPTIIRWESRASDSIPRRVMAQSSSVAGYAAARPRATATSRPSAQAR